MEFTLSHNNSLIDLEKHMQDVLPAMSPSKKTPEFSINGDGDPGSRRPSQYSFRRGPSSFDIMKRAKSQNKKPMLQKRRLLSRCGVIFLVMALLQAIVVTGIQSVIAVLGDFRGGQLKQYLPCVLEGYNASNLTLPENSTFPSFGKDKEIYVVIFIFLVVYNLCLCLYALIAQRIVEVWSFVAINFLLVIYASVQVYQFRGFGEFCDQITLIGWLAMGNVFAVLMFNIMFCMLALQVHAEFGWKVYKLVNCNPALRFYYRYYEVFLSIVKVTIVFTIAFLVGQAALILPPENYEFGMSYPFIIAMIALYFYAFLMVRRESHIGALALLVIGILLIAYYCFKIYRYVTRSCPACKILEEELNERREDFQHLIMMASLNMVVTILYILILLRVWAQFGNGLSEHFYIHGFWFDRLFKKKPPEIAYLNSVGAGALMKQKSSALLLVKFKSVDEPVVPAETNMDSKPIQRNSSLVEKDYVDYVYDDYTPSTDTGKLPNMMSVQQTTTLDLNHTGINRTFSLPPILENPPNISATNTMAT